jgi:putative flippase GtrA
MVKCGVCPSMAPAGRALSVRRGPLLWSRRSLDAQPVACDISVPPGFDAVPARKVCAQMVDSVGAARAPATPTIPPLAGPPGPLLKLFENQRLAFVMVGVVNTLIGYFFFIGFELTVGPHTGYVVVLLLAHVASVLCAFALYRRLVFRVRGHVLRDLARFEVVYLTALATNLVLLPVLVEWGGLRVIAAQSFIVLIGAVISFVGHKHFSFRRPRATS